MSICCIEGCRGPNKDNEVYFEFPTSRLLRKRWLDAISTNKVVPDSRICCKHFAQDDYEMVRGKMRLRSKVVPTLLVGNKVSNDTESSQESTKTAEINTTNHINSEKNHNETKNDDEQNGDERIDDEKRICEENGDQLRKDDICDDKNGNEKSGDERNDDHKTEYDDKGENHDKIESDSKENGESYEKNLSNRNSDTNNIEKSRKTRFKITPKRVFKPSVELSEDSVNSSDSVHSISPQPDASKEDIEGILTHYYIENKKTERQVAAMTDALPVQEDKCTDSDVFSDSVRDSDPVFIELSVGQEADPNSLANDCLMVLESVQCEIDPSMILDAQMDEISCDKVDIDDDDDDDDDVKPVENRKEDPISLLTSSDEDDVILQEPKIDTVEVSSAETDEDDIPLVKLVKTKKKIKKSKKLITKLLWGGSDFYCAKCRYTTVCAKEFNKHVNSHSKVVNSHSFSTSRIMHICSECGYTTCSEFQLNRHKQKHKNDKRFKCDLCKYTSKHSMSLMYHMKTHKNDKSPVKKLKGKRFSCNVCEYGTDRVSDLRRHRQRKHQDYDGDDEDYCPGQ